MSEGAREGRGADDAAAGSGGAPSGSRPGHGLTPEEEKKRKQRNAAIALGLAGFIVLVFLVTIFRIGGDIASRPF